MIKAVLLFLLGTGIASAGLPLLTPTRIVKDDVGGDYTTALIVEAEGKKVFLKSLRSKPYADQDPNGGPPKMLQLTRWGNFEADILAKELFNLVDVQCPASRVVKLPPAHAAARALGDTVVAMEFVDQSFARGGTVHEGFWPGAGKADVDAFVNMALVDVLMGNADRRDPNYFVAVLMNGMVRPIPIDNNSGFCTFLVWTRTSNLINFFPSYSGMGSGWPWEMVGTVGNIVTRGGEVHHVHEKVLEDRQFRSKAMQLAKALAAKLTDKEIDRMVALIPEEVIPPEVRVQFSQELVDQLNTPELKKLAVDPIKVLQGKALFKARIEEIKSTLKWRRSNLVAGLTEYFKRQGGPVEGEPVVKPPVVTQPPVIKPPVVAQPPVGKPPVVTQPPVGKPPVVAQPPVVQPRPRPTLAPWPPIDTDHQPWMPFPGNGGAGKEPGGRKDLPGRRYSGMPSTGDSY